MKEEGTIWERRKKIESESVIGKMNKKGKEKEGETERKRKKKRQRKIERKSKLERGRDKKRN